MGSDTCELQNVYAAGNVQKMPSDQTMEELLTCLLTYPLKRQPLSIHS